MKKLIFIILLLLTVACKQKSNNITNGNTVLQCDTCIYQYELTKNVIINSTDPLPIFEIDSLENYTWSGAPYGDYIFIEDYEGNYYFSRKIADITPAILTEGIYQSLQYSEAKFFIYNDIIRWNHNENKVFIGTLINEKDKPIITKLIKSYKGVVPVLMYTPNDRITEDFDKFKEIESKKAKLKSNTPNDFLIENANVINELGRKQKAIKEKQGTLHKYSSSQQCAYN